MIFQEAMSKCQNGQYVKRIGDSWSEYSIQYLKRFDTGEECWMAGGTCGGPLTKDRIPKSNHNDYEVYTGMYK